MMKGKVMGETFTYRIFRCTVVHVYKNCKSCEIRRISNGEYVDTVSAKTDDQLMDYIDREYFGGLRGTL